MCTYVILFAACGGTGVSTGIVGTLGPVSHGDEQRRVCTGECVDVCLLLAEWQRRVRRMQCLAHWDASKKDSDASGSV